MKYIKSVEVLCHRILRDRVELTMANAPEHPRETHRRLGENLSSLQAQLGNSIYSAYSIGHFDGFEEGQMKIKKLYSHLGYDGDHKIYSPITSPWSKALAIDLYSEIICECKQCNYCIHRRNSSSEEKLLTEYQLVKDTVERLEVAHARKHGMTRGRCQKRRRLAVV